MKNLKSLILAVLAILTLSASAQQKKIHVLALNDMHAFLDRAAVLGGVIDSLRALYPEMLIFSSGDNRTGNPVNDQFAETNRPMMDVMNAMGINASALGNHEFDGRISGFKANQKSAHFPFLCANIHVPDSMGFKIDPYKIFEVDGVKIGVVSILQVNPRGIPDCLADNVKGLRFSDPKAAALKYEDIVAKQCDIQLLLTHIGVDDDKELAKELTKYHAILGGHSHSFVESNTVVNNILITQNVNKMKYCTLLEFVLEDGKVVSKSSNIINVASSKLRNQKLADMVAEFNKDPFFSQKVGTLSKPITDIQEMGSMVTDGQRYGSDAEVTLQNFGGVRYETHDAGTFNMKDALMLDPFGNKMMQYKLNVAEIKKLMEESYVNDEDRYPFVSGIKYEMVIDKATNKPASITIFNEKGKKLKDKKSFVFSCNNYVVSITFLKDREGKFIDKTSCDCLIEYLKSKESVDYTGVVRAKIIEK